MRHLLLLPALLLAACGGDEPATPANATTAAAPGAPATAADPAAPPANAIPCALPESPDMAPVCTLETGTDDEGEVLTLRQPDGGFRRLRWVDGGAALVAADGAEEPSVKAAGEGQVEVTIGGARYRIPAR